MSGYFQRLAQRSGLGEQPKMTALAKPEQPPITEVEAVREASQPTVATSSSEHELMPSPRRTGHISNRENATNDRGKELVPRIEHTASSEPVLDDKKERSAVEPPSIDTSIEQVEQPAFIHSETASEHRLPETIQVESLTSTDDKGVQEKVIVKGESSAHPALPIPSFIRDVVTLKEQERVLVRSDKAPVIEPKWSHPESSTEPEFLQSTVSVDAAPLEKSASVEQTSWPEKDTGPRIQIGQIQIEVYAPPSQPALQAVPKPGPRSLRSAKAPTRSPDLRRYYLRGF